MEKNKALPFLQMPLDSQIKLHGGKGFNCEVKVTPVPGTYSFNYEFYTDDGAKILTSVNQFQLGVVNTAEDGLCHIIHNADKNEYLMFRVNRYPERYSDEKLSEFLLGYSYEAALSALRSWYPNFTNWNLTKPILN